MGRGELNTPIVGGVGGGGGSGGASQGGLLLLLLLGVAVLAFLALRRRLPTTELTISKASVGGEVGDAPHPTRSSTAQTVLRSGHLLK